jgi:hypothetical protein
MVHTRVQFNHLISDRMTNPLRYPCVLVVRGRVQYYTGMDDPRRQATIFRTLIVPFSAGTDGNHGRDQEYSVHVTPLSPMSQHVFSTSNVMSQSVLVG